VQIAPLIRSSSVRPTYPLFSKPLLMGTKAELKGMGDNDGALHEEPMFLS